jgi:hypothetical protein
VRSIVINPTLCFLLEVLAGHEADQRQEIGFAALHAHAHRGHAVVAVDGVIQQAVHALLQTRLPRYLVAPEAGLAWHNLQLVS